MQLASTDVGAKRGEDIIRANREVGEVYHMGLERFIQKTKKGSVQAFLMFDKRLVTKLGWRKNTDSVGGKQCFFKMVKEVSEVCFE